MSNSRLKATVTKFPDKSKCCGESIRVVGRNTHYYVCNKCNNACDKKLVATVTKLEDTELLKWAKEAKNLLKYIYNNDLLFVMPDSKLCERADERTHKLINEVPKKLQ